jgi:hypothetical protein
VDVDVFTYAHTAATVLRDAKPPLKYKSLGGYVHRRQMFFLAMKTIGYPCELLPGLSSMCYSKRLEPADGVAF